MPLNLIILDVLRPFPLLVILILVVVFQLVSLHASIAILDHVSLTSCIIMTISRALGSGSGSGFRVAASLDFVMVVLIFIAVGGAFKPIVVSEVD